MGTKSTPRASEAKKSGSAIPVILLFGAIAVGALSAVIHFAPTTVFDPEILQQIAKQAIARHGDNATLLVADVIQAVRTQWPQHTLDGDEWMFNNAGGAMGSMTVLHASFSEYVIIFGTAIGTEGHTGRFLADDYFTILYGEQVSALRYHNPTTCEAPSSA